MILCAKNLVNTVATKLYKILFSLNGNILKKATKAAAVFVCWMQITFLQENMRVMSSCTIQTPNTFENRNVIRDNVKIFIRIFSA